jgi:chromosome segregation ATPase
MKLDFTNRDLRVNMFGILFTAIVLLAIIVISGCSSGIEQNTNSNKINFSGDKSFSFKDEGSQWRVDFENDKITSLYKDGNRLLDDEVEKHKEMIYRNLKGLRSEFDELSGNVHRFYFDMDKFGDEMEKFKLDFKNDKFMKFKLDFDDEEFEKNMEKLEENLRLLKDKKIELYFDSEEFKENMKELEENLKDLPVPPISPDVDIDVYLDMNDFKDGMKNFAESFKNFDVKIDSSDFNMSELRESMKELKKNMKGLKIEMHDLKGEMKKLNAFLDELKSELVKDGYIKSIEEEINLKMDKDQTRINDVIVKAEDHTKYKELYKRHFDKEIEGTININKD